MWLFNEEEANEALAVVAPLVERLVSAREDFLAQGERLVSVTGTGSKRASRAGSRSLSRELSPVSDFWQHILVAGVVIALTLVLARIVDRALVRRLKLSPDAMTRYSVLRRTIVAAV